MDLNSVEIKEIGFKQVAILVQALSNEKPEYLKYFTPFEFTVESITKIFSRAVKDKYYGIFVNDELAGFYMMRGLDEGFEIPSYGVWISSKFSNKGLSKLTLYHAFSFCSLNNINSISRMDAISIDFIGI